MLGNSGVGRGRLVERFEGRIGVAKAFKPPRVLNSSLRMELRRYVVPVSGLVLHSGLDKRIGFVSYYNFILNYDRVIWSMSDGWPAL